MIMVGGGFLQPLSFRKSLHSTICVSSLVSDKCLFVLIVSHPPAMGSYSSRQNV